MRAWGLWRAPGLGGAELTGDAGGDRGCQVVAEVACGAEMAGLSRGVRTISVMMWPDCAKMAKQ